MNILKNLNRYLNQAFDEFKPDFVIYNAGTDVLEGDPLGKLALTANVILFKILIYSKCNFVQNFFKRASLTEINLYFLK